MERATPGSIARYVKQILITILAKIGRDMMGWLKAILTENRRTVASWPEWKRRVGMSEPELNDIWAESAIKLRAENARLKAKLAEILDVETNG